MMINSAVSTGSASIQGAIKSLDSSAQEIAKQTIHPIDPVSAAAPVGDQQTEVNSHGPQAASLIEPLVEQNRALYQAQAGAKIISTNNEVLGSLLDIFA
ncbi:MAG TPA: hypothetical protein PLD30_05785 [Candidatus Competibacteraceae bacterium]|nr:hypothetical protein [Candidatus Competibacteraceae bacterium]